MATSVAKSRYGVGEAGGDNHRPAGSAKRLTAPR
jgi:hypothetical protein